jgi:hypothetical protein
MPNSNDVAGNEMLWELVLSRLVVGASVVAGTGATTIASRISIKVQNGIWL